MMSGVAGRGRGRPLNGDRLSVVPRDFTLLAAGNGARSPALPGPLIGVGYVSQ